MSNLSIGSHASKDIVAQGGHQEQLPSVLS